MVAKHEQAAIAFYPCETSVKTGGLLAIWRTISGQAVGKDIASAFVHVNETLIGAAVMGASTAASKSPIRSSRASS